MLTVENARLRWSFTSLLGGRLLVETISADRVARPAGRRYRARRTKAGQWRRRAAAGRHRRDLRWRSAIFTWRRHWPASILHWKLSGHAVLPADLAQGRVILKGDRLDGPNGRLSADIGFDVAKRTVDGEVSLSEKRGGLIAALMERPDIEDLSMRLVARGDAWRAMPSSSCRPARRRGRTARRPGSADGADTSVSVQLEQRRSRPSLQGRIATLSC